MRFQSIFTLFIVLVLSGCSQHAPKPKPFLNEKKMVELLTEMQLTEALLQQLQSVNYHNLDSMALYTNIAYSELFEKYGLNYESFEANLYYRTYYSRDLEKIYTKVYQNLYHLDTLNRRADFSASREDMSKSKAIER